MLTSGPGDERTLVRKLIEEWHLSVADRRLLPRGVAPLSLVHDAVAGIVREQGSYPSGAGPDHAYEGGVLVPEADGTFVVYWRAEASFLRYVTVRMEHFAGLESAVASIARGFGREIDGIPIDPSS